MKHFLITLFLSVFSAVSVFGIPADTLKVEEAVALALENNFKITLAKNDQKIAGVNNSLGAAGMLPSLDLTGTRSLSVNNTRQAYYDGRLKEGKNAATNNRNVGLQLNWTIFDGLNMFIQKEKLNELEKLSGIQLRSVVESTVSQVISTYYEIVAQEALREVYRNALRISEERRKFAGAKFDLGSGSELALLQATVDMNADSANLIRQTAVIENLKSEINLLLCRSLDQSFEVYGDIPIRENLDYRELLRKMNHENPELMSARNAVSRASLAIREMKSQQLPRINFTSGYTYNKSTYEVGLTTSNRSYGYNFALSLAYTIFDGFTNRQKITAARLEEESAKVDLENSEMEISANLKQVYNNYLTNLKLVNFETKSLDFARHNFSIAQEKYRIGSMNDIEFRETQAKLIEAENGLLSARYDCKVAETELLRLSGLLSQGEQ